MQLDELNKAKSILENQLNLNMKSTDELRSVYQTRLAFIIDDIRSLSQICSDPLKWKLNRKRCNPDEK